jgi:glyoxylase-like metal-dependent hydrolase (beta-lactamase superfamily II)
MVEEVIVGALATNCWIYPLENDAADASPDTESRKKPCAVIDPGADAEAIISRLESLGLYPKYILLTHGHFDHIGAVGPLAAHYPDKPRIAIHRGDASRIGQNAYRAHKAGFDSIGLSTEELAVPLGIDMKTLRSSVPEADILLEDGDRVGPFTVIHLPGHSPGSVGFYNEEDAVLFSGDVLFKGDIGRTDLPGGDWDQMKNSLKRLFTLDPKTRVYPGHGPATTLAEERGQFTLI